MWAFRNTHRKTLERVKAKEPTGVKEIWTEQPQQVGGTGCIPKGPAPSQLAPSTLFYPSRGI